ncbi:G5 domain-containing protein [Actinoplanes sp. TFC3]|uniref:G5 domain-containing protein n=1 Tax=Actinoplanes sp. TFC3 TaxID=1710355 RepID=UPI00083283F1|nr:G5 domain-containing protein [Actinoplanes sp. TFC3]
MPRKSFWARLPFSVRMTTAGLGVLTVIAGGAGGIVALTAGEPPANAAPATVEVPSPAPSATKQDATKLDATKLDATKAAASKETVDRSAPKEADRTATRTPRRTEPVTAPRARRAVTDGPVVRTERVSETQTIPFRTRFVRDPSMPWGSKRVQTTGLPGERVLRYLVTYTGDKETSRRLLDSTVTREPRHRVIAFGTRRGDDGPDGNDHDHDRSGDWGNDRGENRPTGRAALCSDDLEDRPGALTSGDVNPLDLTKPCPRPTAIKEKPDAE